MKTTLRTLAACSIGIAASAQSTLTTETPIGVYAVYSGQSVVASRAALSQVPEPDQVDVFTPGFASARSLARPSGDRVVVEESGFASSSLAGLPVDVGTARVGASSSPHSWTWSLAGARSGDLEAQIFIGLAGASAEARVEIDIDADGSVELALASSQASTFRIPVSRPNGLLVRITTFGRVRIASPAGERYFVSVDLDWVERLGLRPVHSGPTETYFAGCGPQHWVADRPTATNHALSFHVRNGALGMSSWLLLGFQQVYVPIPGGLCGLEVTPVVAITNSLDQQGRANWPIAVPGPLASGTLYSQVASLDAMGTSVLTSNTLRLTFRD